MLVDKRDLLDFMDVCMNEYCSARELAKLIYFEVEHMDEVEAIPADWIQSYCTNWEELTNEDRMIFIQLIEDWRKENESNI